MQRPEQEPLRASGIKKKNFHSWVMDERRGNFENEPGDLHRRTYMKYPETEKRLIAFLRSPEGQIANEQKLLTKDFMRKKAVAFNAEITGEEDCGCSNHWISNALNRAGLVIRRGVIVKDKSEETEEDEIIRALTTEAATGTAHQALRNEAAAAASTCTANDGSNDNDNGADNCSRREEVGGEIIVECLAAATVEDAADQVADVVDVEDAADNNAAPGISRLDMARFRESMDYVRGFIEQQRLPQTTHALFCAFEREVDVSLLRRSSNTT